MRTKVGVVQMTSTDDVEANLQAVERQVGLAASDGASLVVIPECFAYLGPEAGKLAIAEPLPNGGRILERCRTLARSKKVELILGGFWEKGSTEGKVKNACVHLDAHGEVRAIYRKIHLFDVDL